MAFGELFKSFLSAYAAREMSHPPLSRCEIDSHSQPSLRFGVFCLFSIFVLKLHSK